jgi:hypothetical protein
LKKILIFLAVLALLLSLSACGAQQETTSDTAESPAETAQPVRQEEATTPPIPTLSPDAEPLSALSGTIQADDQGQLYTTLTRAEGFVYLPDLLPEDMDCYIYGLLVAQDKIYFAAKEEYFSLDPASLYVYDLSDGTLSLLTQDGSAGCTFCLVGDRLFYESCTDTIRTIDLSTGEITDGTTDSARLLTADSSYFYYAKADGGIYRNDSTLTTQGLIMDDYSSYLFFAQEDALCDITYQENGTLAVLEFRDGAGTLRSQRVLAQAADGLYARDGIVYVPQPQDQTILLFDMTTGQQTAQLPLPEACTSCSIQYADDSTVYYLTDLSLWAVSTDGTQAALLGEQLLGD